MMIICSTKVVHCEKEQYDVYIGRAVNGLKGSIWANPFKIGPDGDRDEVIEKYHKYILSKPELLAQLESLRGKTLGCWCKPQDCHGDVLVELLGETRQQLQPQLFDVPRTTPDQVVMSNQMIQEWRYSVSDVVFQDVGDIPVPDEYQALFDEYCAEIDILPVETPMWRSATPEYKNVLLEKSRHKAYTRSLLCSGNQKAMRAAEEAMLNQLDRYYESQQQKEHVEECRKNLLKARQEGRKWTRVRDSQNRRVLGA